MPSQRNPIIQAIDQVFGDTSVSPGTTRARLTEAADHLDMLLSTLDGDDEPETETGYDN